ncbi:hypothetical protein BDW02DRAFT_635851 [Decorospora gaudefroyi]|uniref:C2H2-type domain-containing protein n=1 Tax=Decorospora gaudefroyi TaxID=184978 RepID=A0A6A5KSG8_9PLEO|nr:hypothetical protein BDW02DRAFT_635851 [Decorospora gaudefroyi]
MNGYRDYSAGSQYIFDNTVEPDLKLEISQTEYSDWQHLHDQQYQSHRYEQSPAESHGQYLDQWPTANNAYQQYGHQQHLSTSSCSSTIPSFRSSNNSDFSQLPLRDSVSSSISGWSHSSDLTRDQHISQAEYLLSQSSSSQPSCDPSPVDESMSMTVKPRKTRRPTAVAKDYFKTCVSATKQSRTCPKEHKYFCTICERSFVEKADWKRHEETYQERPEMFQCDLCPTTSPAIYFLSKDFATHHIQSHRCGPCSENIRCSKKPHVLSARKKRMTRTGWGCGFCCHFSSDWTERCNHIANHVEKEGMTVAQWYHSKVIYSLLHRPAIYAEWMQLHRSRPITDFAWNQHSTGRVEGYPESNHIPQLQDYLEFFTNDQDAAALARMAYDKLKSFSTPPPVPPKDNHTTSMRGAVRATSQWAQLSNSILPDNIYPTGVCHLEGWYTG